MEVDKNVTRHVSPELERSDWKALIFHYLGLDHIGHLGGPERYMEYESTFNFDKALTNFLAH